MSIMVFTDGSYAKNKAGYGIHFPNKEYRDISSHFIKVPITSQRAELYAIYKALVIIILILKTRSKTIKIYTDSKYSIGSLTIWKDNWIKNNWVTSNKEPVK